MTIDDSSLKSVLALDVGTTGSERDDRIVSLATIRLDMQRLVETRTLGLLRAEFVFDPGKRSHPDAERVHGFDDWFLRHQPSFSEHAEEIERIVGGADLLVAHDAEFAVAALNREFAISGRLPLAQAQHCTLRTHRIFGNGGSGRLDALAARIGLSRRGAIHSSSENAWLALNLFLSVRMPALKPIPFEALPASATGNVRQVPARLVDDLPRRSPRSREAQERMSEMAALGGPSLAMHLANGRTIHEVFEWIRRLQDEQRGEEALRIALWLVIQTEDACVKAGCAVPYEVYERAAILLRLGNRRGDETAILERYRRQPHGLQGPHPKLIERLVRARSFVSAAEMTRSSIACDASLEHLRRA